MKQRSSIVSEGALTFNHQGQVIMVSPGVGQFFDYDDQDLRGFAVENIFVKGMALLEDLGRNVEFQPASWRKVEAIDAAGKRFKLNISVSQFSVGGEAFTSAFLSGTSAPVAAAQKGRMLMSQLKAENRDLKQQLETRREIEQKLLIFQRLYDTMIHNFPDGVIGILNKEMEYVLIDGKELNEIDLPALGLNGRNGKNEDPELARDTFDKVKKAFEGESVSFEVNSKDRSYNITAVSLPDGENNISEILCVIKNVTERNRVESMLKKALEKERELGELKSRFVTMACHEFKTPLATILSSTFLLENYSGEAYDTEKLLHSNRIRRSVNNLNTILNEFLSIETQNGIDVKIVPVMIDIPNYVNNVLLELQPLKKHGQTIDYKHEGGQIMAHSDQPLLWSIFTNLISNAIKYSAQGEIIQVTTSIEGNVLAIKVKDNGIGIPIQEHKYVFSRFYRSPNAINYEGTGLGLHIVSKNVRLLKGNVSFTSELDKGAEFHVTLPLLEVPNLNL